MASKKLDPAARRLNNPRVRPDDANPQVANGDYRVDQRGASDRDGNAEQKPTERKGVLPVQRSSKGD